MFDSGGTNSGSNQLKDHGCEVEFIETKDKDNTIFLDQVMARLSLREGPKVPYVWSPFVPLRDLNPAVREFYYLLSICLDC